jgi:hypothetical protein
MKKKSTKIYRLAVELLSKSDSLTHAYLNIPRKVFFVRKTELSRLICLGKHYIYTVKIHSSDPKLNSMESYQPTLYYNGFFSDFYAQSAAMKFLGISESAKDKKSLSDLTTEELDKLKASLEKGDK